ncbi:hypothetical protein MRX96_024091 [Rhipicephalus microplus]
MRSASTYAVAWPLPVPPGNTLPTNADSSCLQAEEGQLMRYVPSLDTHYAKDPLYLHPGERGGVWILKRPPGLATIPEEPSSPRSRPDGREQLRRNPRIAGRGGPPITDFLYHPREPFLQGPPAPGLPRGGGPPIGQAPWPTTSCRKPRSQYV